MTPAPAPVCRKSCVAERDQLRDLIEQLETALGLTTLIPTGALSGLSPTLHKFLGLLLARDFVSKEALHIVFYAGRPDDKWPQSDILNVWVCKLRAKLKPPGVPIKTAWARGYYIEREHKQKLVEHFHMEERTIELAAEIPAEEIPVPTVPGLYLPAWVPIEYADLYRVLKPKLGRAGDLRRVIEDQITHDARKAARAKI